MAEQPAQKPQTENSTKTKKKISKNKKILIIVGIVVAVLFILGTALSMLLGYFAKSAFRAATGVDVSTSSSGEEGSVKVKTKDGELEYGTTKKLPKDYPNIVPKFKLTIRAASTTRVNDERVWSVSYARSASSSLDKDFEDTKSKFEKAGWKIETESQYGSMSLFQASKVSGGKNYRASVTMNSDEKGKNQSMTIVVSEKKDQQ